MRIDALLTSPSMEMQVVVVDDSRSALLALANAAGQEPNCHVQSFNDPVVALEHLRRYPVDLVLVDYMMPVLNGIGLIRELRKTRLDVPVVMITSESEAGIKADAFAAGATEFLPKPFDPIELKARVRNLLELRAAQKLLAHKARGLEEDVQLALKTMRIREEEIIWRLSRAMAYRDGDTGDHIDRVAGIARLIAEALGLSEEQCRMIYLATPLHDIGKIGVSDAILRKPGKLTPEETALMREHVPIGVDILRGSTSELIATAARIVESHHEKWDGTGYPHRLKGEAIPIEARIVALADVFDALCSARPYKPAWPLKHAFDEIVNSSGSHFDPVCVDAFRRQWPTIAALVGQDLLLQA